MTKDTVLIAASVAALLVFSAATFLCSKRRRHGRRAPSQSHRRDAAGDDVELGHGHGEAPGLDDAALAAYPTLLYSSSSEKEKEKRRMKRRRGRATAPGRRQRRQAPAL
ncbi:unnamed protein product [Miscanthus lutarioriparius]|uniref:Uncharacterized protein n=1 Tax=Miscanthus lutarioriparius TaxID=422564 RepID=A0A811R9X7_9POAL|nr:unnamed protein product [Miscanthus lutarioriparius]